MPFNSISLESAAAISLLAFQYGLKNRSEPTTLEDTVRRMSVDVANLIQGTADVQRKRDLCNAFWRFRTLLGHPPRHLKFTITD